MKDDDDVSFLFSCFYLLYSYFPNRNLFPKHILHKCEEYIEMAKDVQCPSCTVHSL